MSTSGSYVNSRNQLLALFGKVLEFLGDGAFWRKNVTRAYSFSHFYVHSLKCEQLDSCFCLHSFSDYCHTLHTLITMSTFSLEILVKNKLLLLEYVMV